MRHLAWVVMSPRWLLGVVVKRVHLGPEVLVVAKLWLMACHLMVRLLIAIPDDFLVLGF